MCESFFVSKMCVCMLIWGHHKVRTLWWEIVLSLMFELCNTHNYSSAHIQCVKSVFALCSEFSLTSASESEFYFKQTNDVCVDAYIFAILNMKSYWENIKSGSMFVGVEEISYKLKTKLSCMLNKLSWKRKKKYEWT